MEELKRNNKYQTKIWKMHSKNCNISFDLSLSDIYFGHVIRHLNDLHINREEKNL